MMNDMIAISVSVADTAGAVILKMTQDSKVKSGSRRVSRTKTLDGGCAIYDAGFSHSDRTWTIDAVVSDAVWEALWAIHLAYSLVNIATAEGFFSGCIESAVREEDRVRLSIYVKEKII
jgi:hypothetical protein